MRNIERINLIPVEDILNKLSIKYKTKGSTFSLYEGNKPTSGWKANTDGIFSNFTPGKNRAKGDRLKFVEQYLGCSKREAFEWFEENFNIEKQKQNKTKISPIKEKWDKLTPLTEEQKKYLISRAINPDKLKDIVKDYNGNIALPIRNFYSEIKSIQSRNIRNTGSRYYVEANTDSDGVFFNGLDKTKSGLIVVEGFTDFLSLRQYTSNVVGLLNAKNDEQIRIIKEFSLSYNIFFIPDNDEAGKTTIDKFKDLGIRFNLLKLEIYGVKDINELLVKYGLGKDILDIIREDSDKPPTNLSLALENAKVYKRLYNENNGQLGFPSGYKYLDKNFGGIIKGKVYMIMAYSNFGKTRFAYSLLKNIIKQKKTVNFYSLEVDTGLLFIEMIGSIKGRDKNKVIRELENINLEELEKYIKIYDNIRSLEAIEQHIKNKRPNVAIIDFVQNIEHKGKEYEKMTDIALRIQKLAILTGTTIIQLSQVSNESRFADGTNILPKGSGALFASSDIILSLWGKEGKKFLTISKNKYGPAGINFLLEIDYSTSTFNMTEDILEEASNSSFTGLK